MQINDVTTYELDGDVAVLQLDSAPVNALSARVRQGLSAAVERAIGDVGTDALVIICAGRAPSSPAPTSRNSAGRSSSRRCGC